MPAPTMDSLPAAVDETATPAIPAVSNALVRAVTYSATVSPEVTVGAVMVAVAPLVVCPVIVKFVAGSTVATLPALAPKS